MYWGEVSRKVTRIQSALNQNRRGVKHLRVEVVLLPLLHFQLGHLHFAQMVSTRKKY